MGTETISEAANEERKRNGILPIQYVIEKANESDAKEIAEHVANHYRAHEPLSNSLGMTREESIGVVCSSFRDDVEYINSLRENLTYVARLREPDHMVGRIIGVRLTSAVNRPSTDPDSDETSATQCTKNNLPTKLDKIRVLMTYLEDKLWKLLPADVSRLVSLSILSVEAKYGGMGIGSKLVEVGDEDARQRGFDGVVVEPTAFKSRKIFEKLNYKRLTEVFYADWLDENNNQIFNCADPKNDRATLDFKALQ